MTDHPMTLRDIALKASDRFGGVRGRALGREAEKAGVKIVYTTLDKIIAGTYHSRPTEATIEALATLAQVPVDQVYAAADVPQPGPPFADELPPDVDQLYPHERKAIIDLIRAFLVGHALERRTDLSWEDRASLSLIISEVGGGVDELAPFEEPEVQAARRDARKVRSRGQKRRDEIDTVGEESQE